MARGGTTAAAQVNEVEEMSAGFAGGVNIRDAPNQLAPNECRALENMVLEERGGASKRLGCLSMGTFGAGADRALALYTFYRGASAPQVLLQTTAGNLYYTNDPTANPIVWTLITAGLSTTQRLSFETFNNKCYMGNGANDYAAWDGAAYSTFPTAPKGKYLRLYKDAMWISGIASFPDRVYESNPGDAEAFGIASWVDIAKGDGDRITALGTDGVFLIVFKQNRHMMISDPVTFTNRVVDFEKGCESHFSVVQFESNIYFLSRRGVCEYLGDSPSRYLSYKLDPMWDESIVNFGALDKATAYVIGTRVGWGIPEAGALGPTFQIEYYPRLAQRSTEDSPGLYGTMMGPFSIHRMPVSCFTGYRSGATDRLIGAHNGANKVLRVFAPGEGTDDGVTFQGIVETKVYDFQSIDRTKYVRRMRLLGRGKFTAQVKRDFESAVYRTYPVDMSYALDTWDSGKVWGDGVWGPQSNLQQRRVSTDMYGRQFSIRFVDAETSPGTRRVPIGSIEYSVPSGEWAIFGVTMEGDLLGVRE